MKTKLTFGKFTVITVLCCFNYFAFSQFQQITLSTNQSWRFLTNNVSRIGIGNFPNNTNLQSVLQVNGNTNQFPTGEVFRTNGPSNVQNVWRMFTGTGAGTEKFALFVAANSNHITLQSTLGDIVFNAGGAFERVRIYGATGFTGFGQTNTFTAAAVVHVNANGMNTGEVFRTECSASNTTTWKMFRGSGATGEKVRISSPTLSVAGGTNDIMIENWQRGAMLFRTGQINRMIILDGSNPNALTGFVGIGNNFYAPASQLHVSDGANDTYMQITNNFSDATATDGFRFGVLSTGEVLLNQQEDMPMWFNAGGNARMQILSSLPYVGIGNYNNFVPRNMLHIHDGQKPAYVQFTNTGTSPDDQPAATDGFLAGINNTGEAYLNHQQAFAINFRTDNLQRAIIDKDGHAGIGDYTSADSLKFRLHVKGDGMGFISTAGWNRAIKIEAKGALVWDSGTQINDSLPFNHFFMAHPAGGFHAGAFFAGLIPTLNTTDFPDYVYKIFGINKTDLPLQGTFQFFHDVLADSSVGIGKNHLFPQRSLDVFNDSMPQLRLSQTVSNLPGITPADGIYTDFTTTSAADLLIEPFSSGTSGKVGINISSLDPQPTTALDVDGNGRFRGLPQSSLTRIVVAAEDGTLGFNDNLVLGGGGGDQDWHNLSDDLIPMSFGNSIYTNGHAAIGNMVSTSTTLLGALHIEDKDTTLPNAGYFHKGNLITGGDYNGIYSKVDGQTSAGTLIGVSSEANGIIVTGIDKKTIGVKGYADGGVNNIGLYGTGISQPSYNSYGIWAQVSGPGENFAGYFNSSGFENRGIMVSSNGTGNCRAGDFSVSSTDGPAAGIYTENLNTDSNQWALFCQGNVGVNGLVTSPGAIYSGSDIKFKENINNISNALSTIALLKPSTFTYNTTNYPGFNFPAGYQFGLIAQDIEQVLPDLLTEVQTMEAKDSSGNVLYPSVTYKALNYTALIPITIKGIQELNTKVNNLQTGNSGWSGAGTGKMFLSDLNDKVNIGESDNYNANARLFVKSRNDDYACVFQNIVSENGINIGGGIFIDAQALITNSSGATIYTTSYSKSRGVDIYTYGASEAIGGYFLAESRDWGIAMGIYSSVFDKKKDYAGFFDGNVNVQGNLYVSGTYPSSDVALKENIQPVSNAMNIINQLQPKTFNYRVNEFPRLNLPEGNLYGLIAQDVESILPDLVKNVHLPQEFDSLGNVIADSLSYKALNYTALIPVLVQGLKETKSQNDSLKNVIANYENRFANIEAMLNNCCQNQEGKLMQGSSSVGSHQSAVGSNALSLSKDQQSAEYENTEISSVIHITPDKSINSTVTELYQNRPNPFTTKTTFTYQLGKTGFVELEIHSELGAFVAKLVDMNQEEGSFSIDWNTNDIAPGIYFYSLKVDGQLWVKKAVRIK